MQTRRQFGKTMLTGTSAVALGSMVGMTTMGVSCNTIFTDIENYVPIGIQAFTNVLALVSPSEALALALPIKAVKAAFGDVSAMVTGYQNAPASEKATWKGKLVTALNLAMGEVQAFWNDANLPNGSVATMAAGICQIILSTLAAFIPAVGGTVAATTRKLAKTLPYTPKKRSVKQMKSDINAVFVSNGHPELKVY
jgi:hypothetical protein